MNDSRTHASSRRRSPHRRLLLTVVAMLLPLVVQAWWSPDWTLRKTLAINTTGTGANTQAPLAEVPVLVRLHAGNFPQFLSVRDGGADFRFVAGDDQTPLKYHVERFDPVAQIALAWVKLPAVNPQATEQKFFLYFGNPQAVKGDDAGATYGVDTAAVFHFNETSGLPLDSTAYATAMSGGEFIANPASIIGNGALLTGSGPLVVGDAPQLAFDPARGMSFSLWTRVDELPAAPVTLLERGEDAARLSLTLNGATLVARYNGAEISAFNPVAAATWHHVAVVVGPAELALYLDGAKVGGAPVTPTTLAGALYVGASADSSGALTAAIDELQIASTALPADAVAFAAAVQGERNDAVMTYGGDENAAAEAGGEGEAAHVGHFSIIINNVFGKPDAIVEQVVIGVCALMAAIAIMVMFLKAVTLSRCRRATNRFLAAYRERTAGDDSAIGALVEAADDYDDSPLFTVYQQGLHEVRARLSPAVGAAPAGLEEKSLNAVRATLDAIIVREGQRLNSLLVLLTIAISGGPFIGLLGTVVGVMVTFAAIAATGDVNIAAIAPGMAAALLATVAGLGVAIPALFGYNYLSAKAKDLGADMHVFADEFVARLNEVYGR
ncbi:MAG: DUF2341 domain-containing protein [Gammaproteobacteria bacterium]